MNFFPTFDSLIPFLVFPGFEEGLKLLQLGLRFLPPGAFKFLIGLLKVFESLNRKNKKCYHFCFNNSEARGISNTLNRREL